MVLLHDAVSMEWNDIYMDKYICDDMLEYEVSTRAHEWPYEMDTMVNVIPGEKRASLLSTDRLVNSSCRLRVVCASRGWSGELRHETSQSYQFGHIKETREWILNKTTSTLGLSYEGSSKKRKNTYLWTRCGVYVYGSQRAQYKGSAEQKVTKSCRARKEGRSFFTFLSIGAVSFRIRVEPELTEGSTHPLEKSLISSLTRAPPYSDQITFRKYPRLCENGHPLFRGSAPFFSLLRL